MKTQPIPPGSSVPHDPYAVFVVPDEEQNALEEGPRGPGEGPEEDLEFDWEVEIAAWKAILEEDEKERMEEEKQRMIEEEMIEVLEQEEKKC